MDGEKKPKGWFGTEVTRVGREMEELKEEFSEIKDVLVRYPQLIKLLEHPLIVNYKYMNEKIKRLELMMNGIQNKYADIERQLVRATNLVSQAEQLAKRGA